MSSEAQLKQFRMGMASHIEALKFQLNSCEPHQENVRKHLEESIKDAQELLYSLTGAKSKLFKEVLEAI